MEGVYDLFENRTNLFQFLSYITLKENQCGIKFKTQRKDSDKNENDKKHNFMHKQPKTILCKQ